MGTDLGSIPVPILFLITILIQIPRILNSVCFVSQIFRGGVHIFVYYGLTETILHFGMQYRGRILVQVTIYRRLPIGRDCHLDQSEAYDRP